MLISCEQCSTTYSLDDCLVSPGGVPVQCTRCGHVFMARLPVEEQPFAGVASSASFYDGEKAPSLGSTQIFGTMPPEDAPLTSASSFPFSPEKSAEYGHSAKAQLQASAAGTHAGEADEVAYFDFGVRYADSLGSNFSTPNPPTAQSVSPHEAQEPQAAPVEPAAEPIVEAIAEPSAEAIAEPSAEAIAEPSAEAIAEPSAEAIAEPGAEAIVEPSAEAIAEPGVEAIVEPSAEAIAEPGVEAIAEPSAEAIAEPSAEAIAEPGVEAIAEPGVEAVAEPGVEAIAEPGVEAMAEPSSEAVAEPTAEPVAEPVQESVEADMPSTGSLLAEEGQAEAEVSAPSQQGFAASLPQEIVDEIRRVEDEQAAQLQQFHPSEEFVKPTRKKSSWRMWAVLLLAVILSAFLGLWLVLGYSPQRLLLEAQRFLSP